MKCSIRFFFVVVVCSILLLTGTAAASISVLFNDSAIDLAAPVTIVRGRVMVPFESVAVPLGLYVIWSPGKEEFVINSPQGRYVGKVGQDQLIGDSRTISTGTPPQVIDQHIYVPLQVISNLLGIRLVWDGEAKALRLIGPPPSRPGRFEVSISTETTGNLMNPLAEKLLDHSASQLKPAENEDGFRSGTPQADPLTNTGESEHRQLGGYGSEGVGLKPASGTDSAGDEDLPDGTSDGIGSLGLLTSRVRQVSFIRENHRACLEVNVEQFSGLSINLLQEPPRLVIDIPQAILAVEYDTLTVEDPLVKSVRMSQYQPDVVRIVVDLRWMTGYQVEWKSEQTVAIHLNQVIGGVKLTRTGSGLSSLFETTGKVEYQLKTLREPHRLVVDIAGATLKGEKIEAGFDDEMVRAIRLSQFQPDTVRFVMETKVPLSIEAVREKSNDRGLELFFGTEGDEELSAAKILTDKTGRLVQYFGEASENARWEASPTGVQDDGSDDARWSDALDITASGLDDSQVSSGSEVTGVESLDLHDERSDDASFPFARSEKEFVNWLRDADRTVEEVGKHLRWLKGKRIVIDPGHGGPEVGAAGREGIWEKDVNLQVALMVEKGLKAAGARVYMTRTTDCLVSLGQRTDLANSQQADAFISIHFNASYSKQAMGTETLFRNNHELSPLLAAAVQRRVSSVLQTVNRGIKVREDLYILRYSRVPTALVEIAFLDHHEEGLRFLQADVQRQAAIGVIAGIDRFFELTGQGPQPDQWEREILQADHDREEDLEQEGPQ